MEKLSVEKRTEVSKLSTERLRARLIKAGYDEDEVFEMDGSELLSTCAEYLLSPPIPESPEKAEGGAVGGMSAEKWEFRKQELELRKEELQTQRETRKQEFEFQKEIQEKEEVRREEDQDRQRQRDELELQRKEEENQRRDRENEIRDIKLDRQRAKDEAERKRQESMVGQTRFY